MLCNRPRPRPCVPKTTAQRRPTQHATLPPRLIIKGFSLLVSGRLVRVYSSRKADRSWGCRLLFVRAAAQGGPITAIMEQMLRHTTIFAPDCTLPLALLVNWTRWCYASWRVCRSFFPINVKMAPRCDYEYSRRGGWRLCRCSSCTGSDALALFATAPSCHRRGVAIAAIFLRLLPFISVAIYNLRRILRSCCRLLGKAILGQPNTHLHPSGAPHGKAQPPPIKLFCG